MTNDVLRLTMHEAADLLREGKVSSVELTQATFERIRAVNEQVNAFITESEETALAQAARADKMIAGGNENPLTGVPAAIKDAIVTKGVRTTAGSRILEPFVPVYDANVMTLLNEAGFVMIGKTNMDEFAMGSSGENSAYGPTHNPWALDRVPGGSSAGSAAAVASGMAYWALGSDTGGSVRQPGALSGVVGLKPTYGRVSRYGLIAFGSSLDQIGTLTRSVRDAATVLRAIAGHDAGDPASHRADVPDYGATLGDGVRGLRIGVPDRYFGEDVDAEVEEAFRAAVRQLENLGAEVSEFSPPHTDEMPGAIAAIMLPEAFAFHRAAMRERPEDIGEDVRYRLQLGAAYPAADYIQALRFRETLVEAWREDVFGEIDLVATATTMVAARPIDQSDLSTTLSLIRNTNPFNLLGTPAISVPCGFTGDGLPIGLQLAGNWFDEATVLRAAHAYESVTDWHSRRPPL